MTVRGSRQHFLYFNPLPQGQGEFLPREGAFLLRARPMALSRLFRSCWKIFCMKPNSSGCLVRIKPGRSNRYSVATAKNSASLVRAYLLRSESPASISFIFRRINSIQGPTVRRSRPTAGIPSMVPSDLSTR